MDNTLNILMQFLSSGGNPQQIAQNMIRQNPQLNAVLNQARNGGMSVDQIQQMAQQLGIRFEEFTPELLTVTANMIESDYGETLKGDPMLYVKLAKDFLCDEDFDGTPEEKAYLYYTAIANKEDD